ncbi:hypothetical protein TWF481_001408 [Arthrobotrys musiformis]|uniref:F-box domain-containing protein n=1 Tax=Arthrobotrys musiformis TaxID=47236 RepID=A0AAV9WRC5_9PEZI
MPADNRLSKMDMHADRASRARSLLLAYPPEIWYHVVSFLDFDDRIMFARCSWFCFFIAFPNGVKIPDTFCEWSLKPFVEGGRLVEFRHRISSARFDLTDISNLSSFLQRVTIFPNLRRLEINFISSDARQKQVFDGIFWLLSTLPFYHSITHLAFSWHLIFHIPEHLNAEGRFLDFLVSEGATDKTLENIELPRSLRSLTVFVSQIECLMPLLSFQGITDLVLLHPAKSVAAFPNIKTLTLDTQYPLFKLNLAALPQRFPSVESFSFPRTRPSSPDETWVQYIPNFPKMKKLSTAWPQIDGKNADINVLETALHTKLSTSDELSALQMIKFCGYRDLVDHRRNIVATCVISRKVRQKLEDPQIFEFQWRGNLTNYQDDPGYWDSLVDDSSGDDWEAGNTDKEDSEAGDEDDIEIEDEKEEEDGFGSDYFENLGTDDDLYYKEDDGLI